MSNMSPARNVAQGYGSNAEVMAKEGGTDLATQAQYVERLIGRTFETFSSLLSMNEMFGTILGPVRRVTDLLMVIDEAEAAWRGIVGGAGGTMVRIPLQLCQSVVRLSHY
eukprot:SAG11_NODE_76_length_18005_cov_6.523958_3_plen_110_part_00